VSSQNIQYSAVKHTLPESEFKFAELEFDELQFSESQITESHFLTLTKTLFAESQIDEFQVPKVDLVN